MEGFFTKSFPLRSLYCCHFPGLLAFRDTFNIQSFTVGSHFTTDKRKSVLSFPGLTIGEFRSAGM